MIHEPLDPNDDMLEQAIRGFRQIREPETPAAEILLARVPRVEPATGPVVCETQRPAGSLLGRRPVRMAAAATIVMALGVGWLILGDSGPLAIAQVIATATKHRIAKYRLHQVARMNAKQAQYYVDPHARADYVMYADLASPRLRLERPVEKVLNEVAQQSWDEILDYSQDRYLQLYRFDLVMTEKQAKGRFQPRLIREILANKERGPHQRRAKLFAISRTPMKNPPYIDMTKDRSFLDTLRRLQGRTETVTSIEKLDGRDATRYQLKEGEWTSTVWADSKTKLPIRVEYQVVGAGAGKSFTSIKWVYTDFEWDPAITNVDALFSTKPPQDYAFEDLTKEK